MNRKFQTYKTFVNYGMKALLLRKIVNKICQNPASGNSKGGKLIHPAKP
ncbi:MAG: hypothetical protein R2850_13580 [Bacteroidia bacterium]